jgi:hypothetical protein
MVHGLWMMWHTYLGSLVVTSWSTFIFQGGRMGQGKEVVASFWLVPENQGVGASFRSEPVN